MPLKSHDENECVNSMNVSFKNSDETLPRARLTDGCCRDKKWEICMKTYIPFHGEHGHERDFVWIGSVYWIPSVVQVSSSLQASRITELCTFLI